MRVSRTNLRQRAGEVERVTGIAAKRLPFCQARRAPRLKISLAFQHLGRIVRGEQSLLKDVAH